MRHFALSVVLRALVGGLAGFTSPTPILLTRLPIPQAVAPLAVDRLLGRDSRNPIILTLHPYQAVTPIWAAFVLWVTL